MHFMGKLVAVVTAGILAPARLLAVECGETILQQQISPPAETDIQTFDANAGDRIVITIRQSAGSTIQPLIRLYRSTGHQQVALNGSFGHCTNLCFSPLSPGLPADETYIIEVNDSGLDQVGAYDLSIDAITETFNGLSNAAPSPVCGTASDGARTLTCGATTSGSIDFPSDSDAFVINAKASERMHVTIRASAGSPIQPQAWLFDPSGNPVLLAGGSFCPNSVCASEPLPTTGSYSLLVLESGLDQTGSYDLTIEAISDAFSGISNGPPSPVCGDSVDGTRTIACGATVSGSIDSLGDSDSFVFDADADERVHVTIRASTGSPIQPQAWLFDPSGNSVLLEGGSYCPNSICASEPLPTTGSYSLVVLESGLDQTGSYDLTVEAISEVFSGISNGPPLPVCGISLDGTRTIACGATTSGSIDALGDSDAFVFDADASEHVLVTIRASAGSAIQPQAWLYDPSGNRVLLAGGSHCPNSICASEPLPTTGSYSLLVVESGLDQTGSYDLTIEASSGTFNGTSNGPPAPVCGSPVPDGTIGAYCGALISGSFAAQSESDSISFYAESGEVIALRAEPTAGSNVEPVVRMFGPDGEVAMNGAPLGNFCSGQCRSAPVPVGGVYTVALWDSSLDETGSYAVDFNRCEIPISARAAYIRVGAGDSADDAKPISLATRGITPGDLLKLVRQRDFVDQLSGPDDSTQLCGVFSASQTLDVSTGIARVTDAIDPADGLECLTSATSPGGEATDILQDFRVSFGGESVPHIAYVTVPVGATHIFLAAPDTRYSNNSDPEPDFGVMFLPEPRMTALVAIGAIGCVALSGRRLARTRRGADSGP